MRAKKIKKAYKTEEILLPLKVYNSLMKKINEYKKIQKKRDIEWVRVDINKPN
ncbi:hypothetical protein M1446_04240 [Candidatus Dependentiae bacterium]|nr:hypothetical protein [Candidatus Dependentiae bacterium]